MPRLACRNWIARAAVAVVLLASASRAAVAQVAAPGPERSLVALYPAWAAGAKYDMANQALAEHRLRKLEAKLGPDAGPGHAASGHTVRRIDNLRYRIAVDEWLIRKQLLVDPICDPYPFRTTPSACAYIAEAVRPVPPVAPQPVLAPVSRMRP